MPSQFASRCFNSKPCTLHLVGAFCREISRCIGNVRLSTSRCLGSEGPRVVGYIHMHGIAVKYALCSSSRENMVQVRAFRCNLASHITNLTTQGLCYPPLGIKPAYLVYMWIKLRSIQAWWPFRCSTPQIVTWDSICGSGMLVQGLGFTISHSLGLATRSSCTRVVELKVSDGLS
jgi:hypothetical protein